ncbi:hypothetical protein [Rhizobium sp. YK2]|uniref:hypothetical protein n=1 Tax=Rhizobium sp. YK2 TaxID=1860096 RepID=UPI00159F1508|nr:hypothetical protein [Rhizobium sp. YK2]
MKRPKSFHTEHCVWLRISADLIRPLLSCLPLSWALPARPWRQVRGSRFRRLGLRLYGVQPRGAAGAIFLKCFLEIEIVLSMLGEIIEKLGDLPYGFDDNVAQPVAGADRVAANAHAKTAWDSLKPCGPPFPEAGRITLILFQIVLLLSDPETKRFDDVPRAGLRPIRLPGRPFLNKIRHNDMLHRFEMPCRKIRHLPTNTP